jgi:transcriptional regulator with XRE-family HTH domain/tetratricopeptide (TPR) repeat protein
MPWKPGTSNPLALTLTVLRELRGWTQEELSAASGVGLAMIQKLEQGIREATAETFRAIVEALGIDVATFDAQLAVVRRVRGRALAGQAPGGEVALATGAAGTVAPEVYRFGSLLGVQVGARSGRRVAASLEESRLRAPGLWARLEGYPHEARRALVRESAEFQDAGLCELLCDQSLSAAADSAEAALRLAELAVLAAERVAGTEGLRSRWQGYAQFHVVNALRVPGNLLAAEEALARAAELWQAGAADDPGFLNEARVLHLEASLRRARRQLPQALALLDRALAADHWGETPALLLGKAKALEELGDFAGSMALLRQAAPQIDGEREPRKLWGVHHNLATDLCHLGRHAEAAVALPAVRALAQRLGNQLDWLRVGWLEAKVAAGLGRTAEAVAGFERVRAGFEAREFAYNAALVTLELAELHASLGRSADVKALVRRSAPVFQEQQVHREAQRALELFRRAAEEERVSVELVRSVLVYLQRARHDPQLRYQEVA